MIDVSVYNFLFVKILPHIIGLTLLYFVFIMMFEDFDIEVVLNVITFFVFV